MVMRVYGWLGWCLAGAWLADWEKRRVVGTGLDSSYAILIDTRYTDMRRARWVNAHKYTSSEHDKQKRKCGKQDTLTDKNLNE